MLNSLIERADEYANKNSILLSQDHSERIEHEKGKGSYDKMQFIFSRFISGFRTSQKVDEILSEEDIRNRGYYYRPNQNEGDKEEQEGIRFIDVESVKKKYRKYANKILRETQSAEEYEVLNGEFYREQLYPWRGFSMISNKSKIISKDLGYIEESIKHNGLINENDIDYELFHYYLSAGYLSVSDVRKYILEYFRRSAFRCYSKMKNILKEGKSDNRFIKEYDSILIYSINKGLLSSHVIHEVQGFIENNPELWENEFNLNFGEDNYNPDLIEVYMSKLGIQAEKTLSAR